MDWPAAIVVGAVVQVVTVIVGYFSLKYKASARTLENLEEEIKTRDARIEDGERHCQERLDQQARYHKADMDHIQVQVSDMKETIDEYRETLKKMGKEMTAKTLADIRTASKMRELMEEVTRLSSLLGGEDEKEG